MACARINRENLWFEFSTVVGVEEWEHLYIEEYGGTIYYVAPSGKGQEKPVAVGDFKFYYLDGNFCSNDTMWMAADIESGDLVIALEAVLPRYYRRRKPDGNPRGFLYLEHFFVDPAYRNQGIASAVLPVLLAILGRNARVVTTIVAPCDGDTNHPEYSQLFSIMTHLLEKFGFEEINSDARIWARALPLHSSLFRAEKTRVGA